MGSEVYPRTPQLARRRAAERRGLDGFSDSPKVGYLGPEGTFSEEALLSSAVPDRSSRSRATIYDTIMALRHGEVEWAIVPIENSLDGSVSVTLDLLAEEAAACRSSERPC